MAKAEVFILKQTWMQRVPGLRSADPARLVAGLAESTVARRLLMPVTVPLKMWLSYKVVMALKSG